MDSRSDWIDLTVGAPTDLSHGRPRLQRLAWSALCLLAAVLVWNWPTATSW